MIVIRSILLYSLCSLSLKQFSYTILSIVRKSFLSDLYRAFAHNFLREGGGVEKILHTNHLSENNFWTKGICTRFPRAKEVGGYIEGWSHMRTCEKYLRGDLVRELR